MNCCFLCQVNVNQGTNKVKRRKLSGSTTQNVRDILEKFSWDSYGCIIPFGKESYICYKCKQRVESLPSLLDKAASEKAEILHFIGRHVTMAGPERKRSGASTDTELYSKCAAITPPSSRQKKNVKDDEDFPVSVGIRIFMKLRIIILKCLSH